MVPVALEVVAHVRLDALGCVLDQRVVIVGDRLLGDILYRVQTLAEPVV